MKNLRHQVEVTPGTYVLPPVDLTKTIPRPVSPPIGVPQGVVPSQTIGNQMITPGGIPSFNPIMPPPMMPSQMMGSAPMAPLPIPGPSMIPPQLPGSQMMMDIATRAQIAKMNMYEKDLAKLDTRTKVIDYSKFIPSVVSYGEI